MLDRKRRTEPELVARIDQAKVQFGLIATGYNLFVEAAALKKRLSPVAGIAAEEALDAHGWLIRTSVAIDSRACDPTVRDAIVTSLQPGGASRIMISAADARRLRYFSKRRPQVHQPTFVWKNAIVIEEEDVFSRGGPKAQVASAVHSAMRKREVTQGNWIHAQLVTKTRDVFTRWIGNHQHLQAKVIRALTQTRLQAGA